MFKTKPISEIRAMTDSQLQAFYQSSFRRWCNGHSSANYTKAKKVLEERKVSLKIDLLPDE